MPHRGYLFVEKSQPQFLPVGGTLNRTRLPAKG